jgi:hypothetical protein
MCSRLEGEGHHLDGWMEEQKVRGAGFGMR